MVVTNIKMGCPAQFDNRLLDNIYWKPPDRNNMLDTFNHARSGFATVWPQTRCPTLRLWCVNEERSPYSMSNSLIKLCLISTAMVNDLQLDTTWFSLWVKLAHVTWIIWQLVLCHEVKALYTFPPSHEHTCVKYW